MKPKAFFLALPFAFLPVSGFAQSAPAPLSRAEILGRLALAQPPSYIAHTVRTHGIGFSISADFVSRVKLAGGDGILAERLSAADSSDSPHSLSAPDRPYQHLAKCAEFLHTGDTEQAERECQASIEENPESPWPILATMRVLEDTNAAKEEKAELLRRAVVVAPNLAEAHLALASVLPPGEEAMAEVTKGSALRSTDPLENVAQSSGDYFGNYRGGDAWGVDGKPLPDGNQINDQLQSILEMEPDLAATHMLLAGNFFRSDRLEQGVSEFKKALRLEPGNPELHEMIGKYYASQQNVEEAIAELREAARIVPYSFAQRQALTQTLWQYDRHDEAIREWRDLLTLSPKNVEASEALVEIYIGQKDRKSAIAELRRSLKASSNAIGNDAKYADDRIRDIDQLAHLLCDNREFEASAEQYRFLLRFKPDNAILHNNLGNVLYAQRKVDPAIEEYREALRLQPDLPDAHHNLANCLLIKNKADEAAAEYMQTVDLDPSRFGSRLMVGVALTQKGDLSGAIDQFRQLLLEKPDDPDIHAVLAHALFLNNNIPSAVIELKRSLEMRPEAPSVENELAWIYATSAEPGYRKPAEALTLAKHAVQTSKEPVPAIMDTLAEALLINGHPEEALKIEEQAVQLAPDDQQMQARLKHFQQAAQHTSEQVSSTKP